MRYLGGGPGHCSSKKPDLDAEEDDDMGGDQTEYDDEHDETGQRAPDMPSRNTAEDEKVNGDNNGSRPSGVDEGGDEETDSEEEEEDEEDEDEDEDDDNEEEDELGPEDGEDWVDEDENYGEF